MIRANDVPESLSIGIFQTLIVQYKAFYDVFSDILLSPIGVYVVKLHNYFHPSQLVDALAEWVDRHNNARYHESLDNLTPADVYFGRGEQILAARQQIKRNSIQNRKQNYQKFCADNFKNVNLYR